MLYCDKVSILLRDEGRFYHSFFYVFHAQKVCKQRLFQGKFLDGLPKYQYIFPVFRALLAHQQCNLLPKKHRAEQHLELRFAPL